MTSETTGYTQESVTERLESGVPEGLATVSDRGVKPGMTTSEFFAFLAVTVGVLISAAAADGFHASQAWLIVGIVTSAYILSRGMTKLNAPRR